MPKSAAKFRRAAVTAAFQHSCNHSIRCVRRGPQTRHQEVRRVQVKQPTRRADVRRPNEVRALVKAVTEQLGLIDILVNNAGSLVQRMKIQELTEQR